MNRNNNCFIIREELLKEYLFGYLDSSIQESGCMNKYVTCKQGLSEIFFQECAEIYTFFIPFITFITILLTYIFIV